MIGVETYRCSKCGKEVEKETRAKFPRQSPPLFPKKEEDKKIESSNEVKIKMWKQAKEIIDKLNVDEVERLDIVIRDHAESTMYVTVDIEVKRAHKE